MKILIACEESQRVCIAFREKGHEAYSCDILPCSGGHPEWHIQDDVLKHLNDGWDMMIAHPPCTYLSRAGTRWLFPKGKLNQERYKLGIEAKKFFMKLLNADIPLIVVENPVPHKIFNLPKETQSIQPYEFGEPHQKKTLLWIKGLPQLKPTKIVEPEYYICNKGWRHSKFCATWDAKEKSKTFKGIAKAMAEQWGYPINIQGETMYICKIGNLKIERDWDGNWSYSETKSVKRPKASKLEKTLKDVKLDDMEN